MIVFEAKTAEKSKITCALKLVLKFNGQLKLVADDLPQGSANIKSNTVSVSVA